MEAVLLEAGAHPMKNLPQQLSLFSQLILQPFETRGIALSRLIVPPQELHHHDDESQRHNQDGPGNDDSQQRQKFLEAGHFLPRTRK